MRCFYDLDDEKIDNHFIAIYDSVGIKDYYLPGGYLVRAIHGLPSGVKSTNLIGTIINNIALNYCLDDGKGNKKYNLVTGGDDFCVSCKLKINDLESFLNTFEERAEEIGMKLKFLHVKDFTDKKIVKKPTFYKYCIADGEPIIPTASVLERVFMPWNKIYSSNLEMLEFLNEVLPSLASPRSHLILFYIFYVHLSIIDVLKIR